MTLVRWSGSLPTGNFFDEALERFIKDVDDGRGHNRGGLIPSVDIAEKEDAYLIRAEIPGLGKEHVSVEVKDFTLTISGEKQDQTQEKGVKYHRIERSFGKFERSFYLPKNVDQDNIKASFSNGLLEIAVPKKAVAQAKKIEVAVGD